MFIFNHGLLVLQLLSFVAFAHITTHQQPLDRIFIGNGDEDDHGGPHIQPPGKKVPNLSLYHRRYSEQTFIGTHNSVALRTADNNWSLSGNQYFNITTQLNSGIRLLQAQAHRDPNKPNTIRLCHFNCALMDGGTLATHLATIHAWLAANPTEILTLLFVPATPIPPYLWSQHYASANLDTLSYRPPSPHHHPASAWPTLAHMAATNQRLVTFLSAPTSPYHPPYILPASAHIFETPFTRTHPWQESCAAERPPYPSPPSDRLSLLNHFLYAEFWGFKYPNASAAGMTNAAGVGTGMLGRHALKCRVEWGRGPNFVLVDFFNEGDIWGVERGLNGDGDEGEERNWVDQNGVAGG